MSKVTTATNIAVSDLSFEDSKRFKKFYSNCPKELHPILASRIRNLRMDVEGGNESTFAQGGMHMEISLFMTTDEIKELRKGLKNHDNIWGSVKRSGEFGALIVAMFFFKGDAAAVIELVTFLQKNQKFMTVLNPLYDQFYNSEDTGINSLASSFSQVFDKEHSDIPIEWALNLSTSSYPIESVPVVKPWCLNDLMSELSVS